MKAAGWTNFNLACDRATRDRPAGERHLITVLERGPHGMALATAANVVTGASGFTYLDPQRFSFESFPEARAFVSAWLWYGLVKRKKPRAGGNLSDLGRHP